MARNREFIIIGDFRVYGCYGWSQQSQESKKILGLARALIWLCKIYIVKKMMESYYF